MQTIGIIVQMSFVKNGKSHYYPCLPMNILEPLFSLFNKLDDHNHMPDANWYAAANELIGQIGRAEYQQMIFTWLDFDLKSKAAYDAQHHYYWRRQPIKPGMADGMEAMAQIATTSAPEWYAQTAFSHLLALRYPFYHTLPGRLLRGVLHTAAILPTPEMLEMVETFALNCPEQCQDIMHIYGQLPLGETMLRTRRLRDKLHAYYPIWQIERRLRRIGYKHKRRPLPDIKRSYITTLGFDDNHRLVKNTGVYQLSLDILHHSPFTILWQKDGITLEQPTSEDLELASDAVKDLWNSCKRVNRQLIEETKRLESFISQPHTWNYEDWLPAFIDHPLTGALGKRLIWLFEEIAVIWTQNGFITLDGSVINDAQTIQLWNPIIADPAVVAGWQQYFMEKGILQPFRQAFREVYRLPATTPPDKTDDNTLTGHILVRNQKYEESFDKTGRGIKHYRTYKIEETHAPLPKRPRWEQVPYIQTCDVTFVKNWPAKVPLVKIDPIVYSETLYDIDLYVQHIGIGNDPAWEGIGEDELRAYWYPSAFGPLMASGEIRKIVLKFIVSRLGIGEKVNFEERFLQVKEYKIHIGSGNVLKNDAFVKLNTSRIRISVFLPVEGDKILYLILSQVLKLLEE